MERKRRRLIKEKEGDVRVSIRLRLVYPEKQHHKNAGKNKQEEN